MKSAGSYYPIRSAICSMLRFESLSSLIASRRSTSSSIFLKRTPWPAIFRRIVRGDMWRSEEHTSELQSLMRISYAVFCLKKKTEHEIEQKSMQGIVAKMKDEINKTNTAE